MTIADRFWPKVDKRGPDECWPWLAARIKDKRGEASYGVIARGGGRLAGNVLAHVLSYELRHGKIPAGFEVHHVCRRKDCVNPAHLQLMSGTDHRAEHSHQTCSRGHDLAEHGVSSGSYSGRRCRLCIRERQRLAYARKRAQS